MKAEPTEEALLAMQEEAEDERGLGRGWQQRASEDGCAST